MDGDAQAILNAKLTADEISALSLYYYDGFSVGQVAETSGITKRAAQTIIESGRAKLKAIGLPEPRRVTNSDSLVDGRTRTRCYDTADLDSGYRRPIDAVTDYGYSAHEDWVEQNALDDGVRALEDGGHE